MTYLWPEGRSRGLEPFQGAAVEYHVAYSRNQKRVGADYWEGDATKHILVKRKGFSVKRREGFSE